MHDDEELRRAVIEASVADEWEAARREWEVSDCEVDEGEDLEEQCLCGQEGLRYLYTIRNTLNGRDLYPIGSSCIFKFGRKEMDKDAKTLRELFALVKEAAKAGRENTVGIKSGCFSKALLAYLWAEGVFKPNRYNHNNGDNDYIFLLDMFNKRNPMTPAQGRKATAVIRGQVYPYLREVWKRNHERRSERMKKIKNWVLIEEADGDFERLEPGGYVVRITDVEDHPSEEYLEVVWDVAEGEHAGFYGDEWGRTHPFAHNDRWYYNDKAEKFFKSKLVALEQSNRGRFSIEQWQTACDERQFVGLEVGMVLQKLLRTNRDGKDTDFLEVVKVTASQDIRNGDYKLPEPRDLRKQKDEPVTAEPGYYDDLPFSI